MREGEAQRPGTGRAGPPRIHAGPTPCFGRQRAGDRGGHRDLLASAVFSNSVGLQYSVWSGATLWGSALRTLSKASCRASTRCDSLWAGQSCPRGNTLGSAARGRGAGQRPRHHGARGTSEAGDAPAACALRTKTALRKEATPLCATGSPLLAHGRAPRRARGSSPRFPGAGGAAAPSAAGGAGSAARPAVLTCVFADEVVRHGKLALI